MAKSHRGKPLRKEGFVRGECPITGRTGVKLVYEYKNEAGETVKISKSAHAKMKNLKRISERKEKAETIKKNIEANKDTEKESVKEEIIEASKDNEGSSKNDITQEQESVTT